jgi:hypothetical protein
MSHSAPKEELSRARTVPAGIARRLYPCRTRSRLAVFAGPLRTICSCRMVLLIGAAATAMPHWTTVVFHCHWKIQKTEFHNEEVSDDLSSFREIL